jgi:DNA-directed RNA polymerase subunit K/omega
MSVLTSLDTDVSPFIEPKSLDKLGNKSGNVYRSIVIIGKRANQISSAVREELHSKLQEFATTTDSLEEVFENREQIEISRYYESMPSPVVMAVSEFANDKIYWRDPSKEPASN